MTGKLLDIFSNKKPKEKPREKVIIDYREKNSLVASEISALGMDFEFKELKVADYIVKGIAIERKTVSDFVSSMINHRLLKQMSNMKQYKKHLLLVEGIEEQELYNDRQGGVNGNAIRGFLLSIVLKYRIPLIFTKNPKDTAKFINILSRKKQNEVPLQPTRKALDQKEQMQFILESFPGIGPKNARKLLEEFGSLKNIFNSPLEKLKKTIGKKAEVFEIIRKPYLET